MINFKTPDGLEWTCDLVPNECPICHYAIDVRLLTGATRQYQPMGLSIVEVVFQCPRADCLHAFIGRYDGHYDYTVNRTTLILRSTTPYSVPLPKQPNEVTAISPQFVEVHGEAAAAEGRGLKQVAGCGYRKALEFLVKDFCISESPAEAEAIKEEWLGDVIKKRIADPNIKAMAKRAAWLGNDESHYVRKWEDKDIEDLKKLIELTVSWINTRLLTKKYKTDMPD